MKTSLFSLILAGALLASGAANIWQWQRTRLILDSKANLFGQFETFVTTNSAHEEFTMALVNKQHQASQNMSAVSQNILKKYDRAQELNAAKDEYIAALEQQRDGLQADITELKKPHMTITHPTAIPVRREVDYSTPAQPEVDLSRLSDIVQRKAEQYYSDGRKNGSGETLVFGLSVSLDEPRAVPGWTGRYEIKGTATYNYYESIKGGAFTSGNGKFTALVDSSGIVDFSPGF